MASAIYCVKEKLMATAAKFRIDVAIHDLLMNSTKTPPMPAEAMGLTLPEPVFPRFPDRLKDPGPETPPEKRQWGAKDVYRTSRGWLFPYVRSRIMPGEFHPITAYLFIEYKCNLDCWYCWSFDNKIKGMTEDVARRSIDGLHDHRCRVLALMGSRCCARISFTKWFTTPRSAVSGFTSRPMDVCSSRSSRTGSVTRAHQPSISRWTRGTSRRVFPMRSCQPAKISSTSCANST